MHDAPCYQLLLLVYAVVIVTSVIQGCRSRPRVIASDHSRKWYVCVPVVMHALAEPSKSFSIVIACVRSCQEVHMSGMTTRHLAQKMVMMELFPSVLYWSRLMLVLAFKAP
jgi:hypothetical protein